MVSAVSMGQGSSSNDRPQVKETFVRRTERFLKAKNENLVFLRAVNGSQDGLIDFFGQNLRCMGCRWYKNMKAILVKL